MLLDLALYALAALLGLLMARTSLCMVAGVQQCLRERRFEALRPMLAAASAAGLVLLATSLLLPRQVALPGERPLGLSLLAGGVLLGAGALVNGACYLGSVLYLGRGNANFLFTLLGLGVAARAAVVPMAMPAMATVRMAMGQAALLGLALSIALLWLALRARRHGAVLAAGGAGLVAGAIFVLHPGWSYGVVVESVAQGRPGVMPGLVAALLMFAGATLGALLQHRWQFAAPAPLRAARCLAGGFLMGWGAHLIPGGNDMLLLWAIPGLTRYGLLGWLVMALTTAVLLAAGQGWAKRAR